MTLEAKMAKYETFVDVIAISELPPNSQKTVFVENRRVLLCNTDKGLFALEDKCTHALQPLVGGKIEGGIITCPKHGARFDLATGKPTNNVSKRPVKVFELQVRDGRIQIDLAPRII